MITKIKGSDRPLEANMGFKIILFVFAVFVPMTIFGIAKSYCDWADEQEKRKEAAKWNR